ncbi:uncharacterized protein LOC132707111 isoform X2 [Cylas formicarius]|uniref:uncharacterized protein LOC132707111 isoform X2 n=1 Tax=Cylas formicarius TaxID=197179 RepID=UPI0029586964|nr:uncharacterized protein LOC132707111 isoform X2 [Cylas formicarius]
MLNNVEFHQKIKNPLHQDFCENEIDYEKPAKGKSPKNSGTKPILSPANSKRSNKERVEEKNVPSDIVCPKKETPRPLFALRCTAAKDCSPLGDGLLCCDGKCLKGVKPPKPEPKHQPVFFGMIHRRCPSDPLPELSGVKECKSDNDCSSRICCAEALQNGEVAHYCRTAEPVWDNLPIPNHFLDTLKTFVGYMQCTPPPPPFLDLFPKPCQNPLDCFPNLCCQERGKRYCRPPKRSLLALVADIGQRIIPEDAAKKFIERIS